MVKAHLARSARVFLDGLGCFRAVTKASCTHERVNVTINSHVELSNTGDQVRHIPPENAKALRSAASVF
jgi:hypothetical protein